MQAPGSCRATRQLCLPPRARPCTHLHVRPSPPLSEGPAAPAGLPAAPSSLLPDRDVSCNVMAMATCTHHLHPPVKPAQTPPQGVPKGQPHHLGRVRRQRARELQDELLRTLLPADGACARGQQV